MRGVDQRLRAALLKAAGPDSSISGHCSEPWASITYDGHRHRLDLTVPTSEADRLAAELPEIDLPMHGHFVGGIDVVGRVDAGVTTLRLEALTLVAR